MPKRIDKLTPAQAARMDSWADEWIEIGMTIIQPPPADPQRDEGSTRAMRTT